MPDGGGEAGGGEASEASGSAEPPVEQGASAEASSDAPLYVEMSPTGRFGRVRARGRPGGSASPEATHTLPSASPRRLTLDAFGRAPRAV
jgi:hypothetical protein